ncbi:hypothetical protein [Emticicia sp. SJ17W-69]
MQILFTGGSLKAIKQVISYLLKQSHQVLNIDLTPLTIPNIFIN